MTQMTLLTGPKRRRRWSESDRDRILAAWFMPGAVVADIARQFESSTSLIYKWRKACLAPVSQPAFAPAIVVDGPEATAKASQDVAILIELPGGARLSVAASAPAALVVATLKALRP
jgi:transposase